MATTTSIHCDVCGDPATHPGVKVQVTFTTEQTEGRYTTPYLSIHKMDLCETCYRRIVREMPLIGSGAQGHNAFRWSSHSADN